MTIDSRIRAFTILGEQMNQLPDSEKVRWIQEAQTHTSWFTPESIELALRGVISYLKPDKLNQWISRYPLLSSSPRNVGVVMAGNIPAVGFHDFLCVLTSGHVLHAKLSTQDPVLLKKIADLLITIEPQMAGFIHFAERLNHMDAMIATGSDNSARYFTYYFGKRPHIIRQNRTSCAILTGNESPDELALLGNDVFPYFGLGCRNVSKLFVPENYSFDRLFPHFEAWQRVMNHHKYVNNYDYNKSILLVNRTPHYDTGFLLVTEHDALVSPISVVYYESYRNADDLNRKIAAAQPKLQCIVSSGGQYPGSIPFGKTQQPDVWDYADNVDTMQFLALLK